MHLKKSSYYKSFESASAHTTKVEPLSLEWPPSTCMADSTWWNVGGAVMTAAATGWSAPSLLAQNAWPLTRVPPKMGTQIRRFTVNFTAFREMTDVLLHGRSPFLDVLPVLAVGTIACDTPLSTSISFARLLKNELERVCQHRFVIACPIAFGWRAKDGSRHLGRQLNEDIHMQSITL